MVKSAEAAEMQTLLDSNNGFSGSNHIPAFLAKLWKIVDDPSTNDLIYWSEHGNSFLIRNQSKFARELLPLYYKHNNMASFVRQLNMYGFHKVVSVEQGGLKVDKDEMEFAHPFFLRGSESTLELIKRKISTTKMEEARTARPDTINKVILDVRQMKGRQDSMDSKLMSVKRENEALWRELSLLRQKHAKQQQIVSKLLQFLVGMMSSQGHRLGFKRRMPMTMPLMLSDVESLKNAKIAKNSDALAGPVIHDVTDLGYRGTSDLSGIESPGSDSHVKIDSPGSLPEEMNYGGFPFSPSDVDGEAGVTFMEPFVDPVRGEPSKDMKKYLLGSTVTSEDADSTAKHSKKQKSGKSKENPQHSPEYVTNEPMANKAPASDQIPDKAQSNSVASAGGQVNLPVNMGDVPSQSSPRLCSVDELNESALSTITGYEGLTLPHNALQLDLPDNMNTEGLQLTEDSLRHHLDGHVDEVQNGLDNLKNLLKEDIALDRGTLITLFGGEADRNKGVTTTPRDGDLNTAEGLNLVAYNPSLYELAEDDSLFGYENDSSLLDEELESMLTTDRENLMKADAAAAQELRTKLEG